jgi:protein ImuA
MPMLHPTSPRHNHPLAQPPVVRADGLRCPLGAAAVDGVLRGGIARARIHEIYAANPDDASGAAGFAALLATRMVGKEEGRGKPLIWLRERRKLHSHGIIQAKGLAELCGAMPHDCLFVLADDTKALLRAGLDALRCDGFGAVVIEAEGRVTELDLTTSRRFALAAEQSGVTLLLLRIGTEPGPSAAETRWAAASAPSRAWPANAPGAATFDLTLLRQRSGPSGMSWRLEWDRDRGIFHEAALSGAVVSLSGDGSAADYHGAETEPITRQAA